jgi:hypothetical protein
MEFLHVCMNEALLFAEDLPVCLFALLVGCQVVGVIFCLGGVEVAKGTKNDMRTNAQLCGRQDKANI